ncbi:probable arginine--tRNA ligase, mitochondrial [Ruditapes philippinarum]|uniref:probable arginine--tRNA ligase, mitochondrial n=1 Tax=Ruditapes philippinarum TaxID=129788 RepID=UPI00295ACB14|nr:probable arginine--tRNA ligase, mitochondrial [Ruditapes philippinarum]
MRLTYRLLKNVSKRNLLKSIRAEGTSFGFGNESQKTINSSKTVIVEYSSPNIAKPFHVGHLRSTILGNYIANLYERLGWNVVRLNYLGDWGTQFGLLAVGFQRYGNEEDLQANALHHLFEIYVKINEDVAAEKKEGKSVTHQEGMEAFRKMEQGDTEMLNIWQRFKDISIQEYSKLYQRLGVTFTEYHSESMYDKEAISLTERLKHTGILQTDSEGKGYIQIESDKGIPDKVNILKSDGTTLYITRDIAAIMDRAEKYKFDKIHYVVENAQHMHFSHLCGAMNRFPEWNNRLNEDLHVKFGRIEGISTRKGNVVFLKDVLDEAASRFKTSMMAKKNYKIDEKDIDAVTEELGKSSIIVQDLGQRRIKNYKFNWERIMYSAKLQYCHARLWNQTQTETLMAHHVTEPVMFVRVKLIAFSSLTKLVLTVTYFL